MSLSQRSVRSVKWNSLASLIGLPLGFIQTVLLARLLPVEYFGVVAAVNSIIGLSGTVFEFGLSNAYVHRAPETQDEEHATAVFFTLRLVFDSAWAVFLLVFGWSTLTGTRQWVLIFLVVTGYLYRLTSAPQALLLRRVQHRRLAVFSIVVNLSVAVTSIAIAWFTHSIWALLVSSIITLVLGMTGFYLWKPVWKPKLAWDGKTVRYFLGFGSQNVANNILDGALDYSDNLWTGYYLGDLWLGYYSRAFRFAIYPRMLLATPINTVAVGTFAELKFDRLRLSKAFFRISVFLTRLGFLIAGLLSVIAPQFIVLFLGEKWLPMLTAFRLMLLYSLLDPIRVITSSVLIAVGKPQKVSQVRMLQLLTLGIGLFTLGFTYQDCRCRYVDGLDGAGRCPALIVDCARVCGFFGAPFICSTGPGIICRFWFQRAGDDVLEYLKLAVAGADCEIAGLLHRLSGIIICSRRKSSLPVLYAVCRYARPGQPSSGTF